MVLAWLHLNCTEVFNYVPLQLQNIPVFEYGDTCNAPGCSGAICSGRGIGCILAEGVSLGRDSNRDPDRYRANSIRSDNNNIIRNNEDINNVVTTYDLGDGSLCKNFRCGSSRCQFQYKFSPQDRVLSTATKILYNCIVPPGSTYINGHSSNVVL